MVNIVSAIFNLILHFLCGKKMKQKKPPRAKNPVCPLPTCQPELGQVRPYFALPVDMPTHTALMTAV
jgi:hypothetical protein